MPVTIGTLTSNVTVTKGSGSLDQATLERIVRLVAARVKEELHTEEESRREREVRDRQSEVSPY